MPVGLTVGIFIPLPSIVLAPASLHQVLLSSSLRRTALSALRAREGVKDVPNTRAP